MPFLFLSCIRRRARGASPHDHKVSCHGILLETRNAIQPNISSLASMMNWKRIVCIQAGRQVVTGGAFLLLGKNERTSLSLSLSLCSWASDHRYNSAGSSLDQDHICCIPGGDF